MPIDINGTEYDAYVVESGVLEPYDVQLGDGTIIAEHGGGVPSGGVSRWEFEQDTTDSWGSNDGTLHSSVAYTTDAALGNHAIECNGSDGGFRLSNSFDFIQQTAEFTVNCWVNLNTLSTPNFHSVMGTTHDTTVSGFRIMIDDTGAVTFDHVAAGSEGDATVGSLSAGYYHMLTFTGDGSTGRVYIDGVEQSSFAISTTTNTANADLAVGERPDSLGTRVIDGIVDDPRIYDIALTASEISTLYDEGSVGVPPDASNLHAHYDAQTLAVSDGGTIDPLPDGTANGHDLSASGSPTLDANGINGYPSVFYDGNGHTLASSSWTNTAQPNTIYIVYQRDGTGSDADRITDSDEGLSDRHLIAFNTANGHAIWAGSWVYSDQNPDTDPHHLDAKFDGASSDMYIDGGEMISGNPGGGDLHDFDVVIDSSGTPQFAGHVGEILVYNTGHGAAMRSDVRDYIAKRWGMIGTFDVVQTIDDVNGHQGVESDGTNLYAASSDGTAAGLYKLDMSGNVVNSRSNPEQDGTSVSQINHLYLHDDGMLYAGSNNHNSTPKEGYIKVYDPSDLSYVEEHSVGAYWNEGCTFYDGSWWVVHSQQDFVQEYDTGWNHVADHTTDYSWSGTHKYQGIIFVGDYAYLPIHDGTDPKRVDVYHWNGSSFDQEARLYPPTSNCTQGLAKEPGEDRLWWASRNTGTNSHDIVESTFSHDNGAPTDGS